MSNLKKQFTPYKDVIKPDPIGIASIGSTCVGQFHNKDSYDHIDHISCTVFGRGDRYKVSPIILEGGLK
jgi:hypothetical protein